MQHFHNFFDLTDEPTVTITDGEEELRPLVFEGVTYVEYSVSNLGNIYSHKSGNMVDRRRSTPVNISHVDGQVNGRGGASYVSLSLKGIGSKRVTVHKLVMATFRPVDQYPPKQIPLEDYRQCPQSVKDWIQRTVVINHIDHNCHNNHVDNLEYTTQLDNTQKAVKHHGGSLNNKNKYKNRSENTL